MLIFVDFWHKMAKKQNTDKQTKQTKKIIAISPEFPNLCIPSAFNNQEPRGSTATDAINTELLKLNHNLFSYSLK